MRRLRVKPPVCAAMAEAGLVPRRHAHMLSVHQGSAPRTTAFTFCGLIPGIPRCEMMRTPRLNEGRFLERRLGQCEPGAAGECTRNVPPVR